MLKLRRIYTGYTSALAKSVRPIVDSQAASLAIVRVIVTSEVASACNRIDTQRRISLRDVRSYLPQYLDRPASLRTQSAAPTSQGTPSFSSLSPPKSDQRISGGVHALIQPFPLFNSRARPSSSGQTCLTRIIGGPDLS